MNRKTHKQKIAQRQLVEPYRYDPAKRREMEHEADPLSVVMEIFGHAKPASPSVLTDYSRLCGLATCINGRASV